MKLELISFDICPFVQRSVITLRYKNAEFDITYIDLENPPPWFTQISPLGKVPALRIDDNEVLFESAVINEYLDDITAASLKPKDPLTLAKQRAWIVFGEQCLHDQYNLMSAKTQGRFKDCLTSIKENLERLEAIVGEGPYFSGTQFSLVDAAYAPLFMRYAILNQRHTLFDAAQFPKLMAWSAQLLALEAVTTSVVEDFQTRFIEYIEQHADYAAQMFCKEAVSELL